LNAASKTSNEFGSVYQAPPGLTSPV